ncbi:MAG: L-serine ammonia-lyase, iron-sulfur-dependent, subunit alpha [Lachnospiraceae bacterium]|nr:L-serine ammonia-lyase, iron-sulfur-dependent, subunit alpha [Robinsoniella sp.]MDY3766653.1 L-serine ammonia-lyase, iron-sulfur-dependent, subunit alpha [Lachnospiraceae bacterium]
MSFRSLSEILKQSEKKQKAFWEIIVEDDMTERQVSKEDSFSKMNTMYQAMRDADLSYNASLRSASGLVGGDGEKLICAMKSQSLFCSDFLCRVMARAIKMGESNACMRRIVAAPTAGSCGVLPAVLLTCEEERHFSSQKMLESLFVAAGIGEVIASRAFISGAEGGCQAEIGSASAMAAGAVAYLNGGDNDAIVNACALALKNLLGLACDPIAGLVEVPCVKRNMLGAVNAITSADLAISGIRSVIPADEVIDAMRDIGIHMPRSLRETGEGGLAATPTGIEIANRLL